MEEYKQRNNERRPIEPVSPRVKNLRPGESCSFYIAKPTVVRSAVAAIKGDYPDRVYTARLNKEPQGGISVTRIK